ncbi:MAG TPA: FmdB family zinc ribbon protein [Vicinamibacterales bacterium]|jgi:putative FmdB family regulatory protein|nr:FmdB family zinc ribbon protein [Vicinamibacterales bacterium]
MPLYEYECDACGHRFEKIQKFSDPLEDTCPKCGGHVHKLMSSPAIQFKGSGFYITDYPKGDKGTAPKSDGGKADREAKVDKPAASTEGTSKTEKSTGTEAASSTPAASTASASTPAASPSTTTSTSKD